jgi:hypothetical protein
MINANRIIHRLHFVARSVMTGKIFGCSFFKIVSQHVEQLYPVTELLGE